MAKKSASINLLKSDRNETLNQIINWALTIGRVLVIVIELVALTAFLYRFSLDNQLQDLHTRIKQQQAIVASQKKNEDTYRNLQDRLTISSSFADTGQKNVKVFKDILSFAPNGMTFNNVSLFENRIRIEANVNSVIPLSVFVNALKAYPKGDTVSIDKIENKTSSAVITVSISVTLKQQGGQNANSRN